MLKLGGLDALPYYMTATATGKGDGHSYGHTCSKFIALYRSAVAVV